MRITGFVFVVAAVALPGCGFTETGDAIRAAAVQKSAQAMDQGLVNAEWFICNAVSVGAARRRYGRSPELAVAYRTLCNRSDDLKFTPPK